jgi:hypothetical protein
LAALPWAALAASLFLAGASLFLRARRRPGVAAPPEGPKAKEARDGNLDRRRVRRRRGLAVRVLVRPAGSQAAGEEGRVVNRSTGGLGLELGRPAEAGAVLEVRSPEAPVKLFPWVRLSVRHCTPVGRRRWLLGCQFTRPQPWSTLLFFG